MFKLAFIGLDTSHSIAFTELIQGENNIVEGLRVVNCMRFPSAFQSESGQDERQITLEKMGVKVTNSFEEAVSEVDGILLEINDPALHLEYFEKAAELGLPVFIDKPLADSFDNGKKIVKMARDKNIPVWSSSSLRFIPEIIQCREKVDEPMLCQVFGPLGEAARGSSLVWYGVHAFEMLSCLMGTGAQKVHAREDARGVVAVVEYADERRAVVECNKGAYKYGGRAQNSDIAEPFIAEGSPYPELIKALRRFFLEGHIPVPLEHTLEIQAMMEAAEKSLSSKTTQSVRTDNS